MKLKQLKKLLDGLTDKELNQDVLYDSYELCLSGKVKSAGRAKQNLYYTGDDHPSKLLTLSELKEEYDKEEIASFDIEIPKGAFVIKF